MDISLLIILWIVFAVIQGVTQKKNPDRPQVPPQDSRENLDFEIPTLANDPNFPGEEPVIFAEDLKQSAEVREFNVADLYAQKKSELQTQPKEISEVKKFTHEQQENFSVDLTPAAAMNAIILGEILGKPKALRNSKRL